MMIDEVFIQNYKSLFIEILIIVFKLVHMLDQKHHYPPFWNVNDLARESANYFVTYS